MIPTVKHPEDFKAVTVVFCPHCGYQNLSWRFVCTQCTLPLEIDEDTLLGEERKIA